MSQELETVADALEQTQIELAMCEAAAQNIPEIILTLLFRNVLLIHT
jgi:hypothetical protein